MDMDDIDGRPFKRARMTPEALEPSTFETNADFVALEHEEPHGASAGPRAHLSASHPSRRFDPRNRFDRPKSKHALPGCEPWVLVKTKLGRRFVHNTVTLESLWRIPQHLQAGIEALDDENEKQENAAWAEEQLRQMRINANPKPVEDRQMGIGEGSRRRRRSESLQREDEEAMLAELAADVEKQEAIDIASSAAGPRGYLGAASDSEYEYIEVTDSEGEHGESDEDDERPMVDQKETVPEQAEPKDGPVEFGEDDIAYQLAMMGEAYGLDPEEYDVEEEEDERLSQGEEPLTLSKDEATALFFDMLDEHGVSPFTPWDKIIADTASTSVVLDDRYTLLSSSKARKDAWEHWSRERAAQIQVERATQEKKDPRIPFLEFLAQHASTKLYWPEFKRKFKREPELNDRALQDKDREKLYRELIAKLKLPESKRKDEVKALLKASGQSVRNGSRSGPEKVLASPSFYSLSASTRQQILETSGYRAATSA